MKLAKSDEGWHYSYWKQISEHEYGKGRYYNEYYNDDLDLVITDDKLTELILGKISRIPQLPHVI